MKVPLPITHDDRVLVYVIRAVDFFLSLPVDEYTLTIHRGWNQTTTHKIVSKSNLKFELLFQLGKRRHEIIFVEGFCLNTYVTKIQQCYQYYSTYWGPEVMMKTLLGICSSFIGEEHKFDDVTLLTRLKVALDGVRTGGPLTYYSDRNWPLAGTATEGVDILTVETTDTWRSVYIIHPDGTVSKVENRILTEINQANGGEWIKNHCFHPYLLSRVAKRLGASICPHAHELAAGRWADDVLNLFTDPHLDSEEEYLEIPDMLRRNPSDTTEITSNSQRSRKVFCDAVKGRSFKEIGQDLGLSGSRTRQLFEMSLVRMRTAFIKSDRSHPIYPLVVIKPFSNSTTILTWFTPEDLDVSIKYIRKNPDLWINAYDTFVAD